MMRIPTAVAAVLVLSAMSACGSQDPPAPAPTTSAAPTVSPTTSDAAAAAPTMPDAAGRNSKPGAEAFVGYYFAVVSYAQQTGDTAELNRIQQPTCTACSNGVKWINSIYRKGGYIEGGVHQLLGAHAVRVPGHPDTWIVDARVHGSASRSISSAGHQHRYPADTFSARFVVSYRLDWRVNSWADR